MNCAGRADNTQENTNQDDLLIQEYCIPAKMSKLFLPRCQKWPRAFLCKYLKLLSNLFKASSSTVSLPLPAITKNPSQPRVPSWLLQPQLLPWLPQSLSPAAAASCCSPASGLAARCTLSSTRSWSLSGTSTGMQGYTSRPPSLEQPCRTVI